MVDAPGDIGIFRSQLAQGVPQFVVILGRNNHIGAALQAASGSRIAQTAGTAGDHNGACGTHCQFPDIEMYIACAEVYLNYNAKN
jgi:hypothetical protein